MNWFKLAFPLVETPSTKNYLQVGHDLDLKRIEEKHKLWIIFIGMEFEEADVADYGIHTNWLEEKGWDREDILAAGRYIKYEDEEQGTATFQVIERLKFNQSFKDQVVKILDRKYNHPEIMEF